MSIIERAKQIAHDAIKNYDNSFSADALLAISQKPLSDLPLSASDLAGYLFEDVRRTTFIRDVTSYIQTHLLLNPAEYNKLIEALAEGSTFHIARDVDRGTRLWPTEYQEVMLRVSEIEDMYHQNKWLISCALITLIPTSSIKSRIDNYVNTVMSEMNEMNEVING